MTKLVTITFDDYIRILTRSKKKYNVKIYHVKKNSIEIDFRKFNIQHIMFFFSKFLMTRNLVIDLSK